ncbi:hypothetical protein [Cobetia sp. L2A1]|uniref:hypothetical protein n=1 Tax=Cobetia sp. L2A1 TaxID=2686360 RepID=UPI00131B96B7|nr:hypothetical protein [Cobetia sp. L2A1]
MNLLGGTDLPLFWNLWMCVIGFGSLTLCALLLFSCQAWSQRNASDPEGDGPPEEHHINDVRQPDMPLPRLWSLLFLITLLTALSKLLGTG